VTGATVIDVVLAIVLLLYAVSGFRMGLLVGSFALLGFLAGGFIGMSLLPGLLELWPWAAAHETASRLLLIAGVIVLALVGQRLLVRLGDRLRSLVTIGPIRAVDAVLGAVASVLAVALLVWFVAGGLRGATSSSLARAIGGSRVLQTIDSLVPPQAGTLFADFREMLEREGFPRVFEGIGSEPITPAAPPASGIAAAAPVVKASGSVVQVSGVADACQRGQEGSGWVVSRERVVTNAHVVAGVEQVSVQATGMPRALRGRVVVFDPSRDLAVVAVPGLQLPVLPLGPDLARGDEAVVAGYPLSGPLRLDPARVRDEVVAVGSDIYGQPGVRREVYSLLTRVEPGNSGGPLLTAAGAVSGVIFAKSLDDDQTGYALTIDEARPVLTAAPGATTAVSTGACTAD
jgi:S1-C subfamily serine protease